MKKPASCCNYECGWWDAREKTQCKRHCIHVVDLCKKYIPPDAVTQFEVQQVILQAQVDDLRGKLRAALAHNRNLAKTGQALNKERERFESMAQDLLGENIILKRARGKQSK